MSDPIAPPMMWIMPFSAMQAMAPHASGRRRSAFQPFAIEHEGLVMGRAVLLQEAAKGIDPVIQRGDADMIGPARQLRQFLPAIAHGVIGMVIGLVDALFGIAADEVHAAAILNGPGHFRAGQGQGRQRLPLPLLAGFRGRAFGHGMLEMQLSGV